MAYTANTPLANQRLKDSQPILNDNFQAIDALINVNHVGFNVADAGKHKYVTFPAQVADPNTGAAEVALYSKLVPLGGYQLFLRDQNNGTVKDISSSGGNHLDGYMRTTSGLLIKWGQITSTVVNGIQQKPFPVSATTPAFTFQPLAVQLTPQVFFTALAPRMVLWDQNLTTATNLSFVATNGAGVAQAFPFYFLAIGV